MFRKLSALLASDQVSLTIAGLTIALAIKTITKVTERRMEHLATLDQAIEVRRRWLADAEAEWIAAHARNVDEDQAAADPEPSGNWFPREEPYPSPVDLDPLGRGESGRG